MSTRSNIGMTLEDGNIRFIYCHSDGYPDYNGKILINHYSTKEKVEELLSMGDASCLGIIIGDAIDFNDKQSSIKNQCMFYKRDRNETDVDSLVVSREEFKAGTAGAEYLYLFENNRWSFIDLYHDDPKLTDLKDYFDIKDIIE
jgi:hypothetical protein